MSLNAKPIILKRIRMPQGTAVATHLKTELKARNLNKKFVNLAAIPLYREDVIFASKSENFLPGEYPSVTIINKLNNFTNNCQTIAKCVTHEGQVVEKTSDKITQLIGQEAYNTLFHALCSVINQEYRIKAILSLLTVNTTEDTKMDIHVKLERTETVEKYCQTDETRLVCKKKRVRKRIRKVLGPYVVKADEVKVKKLTIDPVRQCVIEAKCNNEIDHQKDIQNPDLNFIPFEGKSETVETSVESDLLVLTSDSGLSLPDIGPNLYLNDDSNDSINSTLNSFKTTTEILVNPLSLLDNVERHTKVDQLVLPNHPIMLTDGTVIQVPFKPEDDFHIASRENLQFLDETNRKKLLLHQMQIDYRHCLSLRDEDGNLPIHLAVINNDTELLKRQCVVFKIKNQSVDIPANNGLTALKLSLFRDSAACTNTLLHHGADPFLADEEHSTCAHIAAELKSDQLSLILNHCKLKARNIIIQHAEELQKPGWQQKSDEELGSIVLHHICSLFDKQGYTPLMLASKLGLYENVRRLVEGAPRSVHLTMPTSGNSALFLAVAAASCVAAERGNKSKVVDHFRKTIEILLEGGADPSIDNHCGSNVNLLLQEFNCAELSMLIANNVTFMKYCNGEQDFTKNFDQYVLMNDGGKVSLQEMPSKKNNGKSVLKRDNKTGAKVLEQDVEKEIDNVITEVDNVIKKVDVTKEVDTRVTNKASKPVITENILLEPPIKVKGKTNSKITVQNKVNSKDFVIIPSQKVNTVSSVKKIIWYPLKRKIEDPNESLKKPKVTK